jgi:DUF4097 and DUF4098 domain-containing protein YvlB
MKFTPWFCGCVLVLAGCARTAVEHSDSRQVNAKSITLSQRGNIPASIQKVLIKNPVGQVYVTGTDADFGWQQELKSLGGEEKAARDFFALCVAEAQSEGGECRLELVAPKGKPGQVSFSSTYRVQVPRSVSVDVVNSFGPVEIHSVRGEVRVKNQSGRVFLKSVPGEINASTTFDVLEVDDTGPVVLHNQSGGIKATTVAGPCQVSTSFGAVLIHGVAGPVEARNESGALVVENVGGPVKARTSFGRLRVEATGPAELSNQSGAIEARGIGGDLVAVTSFGNLEARDIQGRAELSNQSGAIDAVAVKGNLKARTSFDHLRLSGQSPEMEAHNQSGSIDLTATSGQTAKINAATSFGQLRVSLPADAKPAIAAHTTFGKVVSDFPVVPPAVGDGPANPTITLNNRSGDIRVQKGGGK